MYKRQSAKAQGTRNKVQEGPRLKVLKARKCVAKEFKPHFLTKSIPCNRL